MNMLVDVLPTYVIIHNMKYEINSNFRTSISFSLLLEDTEISEEDKYAIMLKMFYPQIPLDMVEAIDKIMWFYMCGKTEGQTKNHKSHSNERILDYEVDSEYIYSAFMKDYNIDLNEIEYLHWWKFKSLFNNLSENNKIIEIMKYRSINLNDIKDKEQKKFYKDMKEMYKLEEKITRADQEALEDIKNKLFK